MTLGATSGIRPRHLLAIDRWHLFLAALTLIGFAAATLVGGPASAQNFPFGTQPQAYRPGTLYPTNFTRAQINSHVAAYYDYWKARWLKPDPGGAGWRVLLDSSGTTVSEGQGYGMVIVPLMAGHDPQAKTIFDGLWQFRLAHPSSIDNRLMDWNVPDNDGNDSAFDGDADIAYGLLLAHAQWGSNGAVNYLQQAKNVIAGIKAKTIGPTSKLPMLGDWVNPTSTSKFNQWATRSSDFMLGHFRAYGAATNDAAYWNSVVSAVQNVVTNIQANESAATGLLPDFIQLVGTARDPQPAAANFLEGANDGDYWYNAGRDPWRLGVDAVLNNDPNTLAQVQKINQWIRTSTGGNANNVKGGYKLDGTPLNSWQDHFFIAPFAVAAMTGSTAADQTWLNNLYSRVYQAHNNGDYYADSVTLQSLLVVSGNMWDPMAVLARVSGDYNRDGKTDIADYDAWRSAIGSNTALAADGNGNGVVDAADYVVWRKNLLTIAAGQTNHAMQIPEPVSASLLAAAAFWRAARMMWNRTEVAKASRNRPYAG
jgi:endo-1,4-beta-D-glucanase Y